MYIALLPQTGFNSSSMATLLLLKHNYKPFIYILISCVAVAFDVNSASDVEIVTIKNQ
jgi:hypothetical protein